MGWLGESIRSNLGRLTMMVPGGALLSFTINKFVPMTDSEFRTAVVAGGTLMLGGYMAPLVKTAASRQGWNRFRDPRTP